MGVGGGGVAVSTHLMPPAPRLCPLSWELISHLSSYFPLGFLPFPPKPLSLEPTPQSKQLSFI